MKKYIFCAIVVAAMNTIGYANNTKPAATSVSVADKQAKTVKKDDIKIGVCAGDILILDSRGNVKNRIEFSAPQATSLQDCVGLYQLEVYKITLNLGQGETTGGTISF